MQVPHYTPEDQPMLNIKLTLSGRFEPLKSLSFQIYRLAITSGIKGYEKISANDIISIEAEGDQQKVEQFAIQIEALINGLPLKITGRESAGRIIHYREFRIIHENDKS